MYPVLLSVDLTNGVHISVSSYGFMAVLSFTLWLFMAAKAAEKEGMSPYRTLACVFLGAGAAIIGARLGHEVLAGGLRIFLHPWKVPLKGGLASSGGIIFGFASVPFICRILKLPTRRILDIGGLTFPLCFSVSRIGCLLAGCCGGNPGTYPWAISFPHPDETIHPHGILLIPTQLYMSLANLATFFILSALYSRRHRPGQIFCSFVAIYSFFHFFIQFLRAWDISPQIWGPFRFSHLFFLTSGTIAGMLAVRLKREPTKHVCPFQSSSL